MVFKNIGRAEVMVGPTRAHQVERAQNRVNAKNTDMVQPTTRY